MRNYAVVIEKDEDGYFVASVPAIPGCHTQAKTLDKLMERIRDAIALCLGQNADMPKYEFVGVQTVAVDKNGKPSPA